MRSVTKEKPAGFTIFAAAYTPLPNPQMLTFFRNSPGKTITAIAVTFAMLQAGLSANPEFAMGRAESSVLIRALGTVLTLFATGKQSFISLLDLQNSCKSTYLLIPTKSSKLGEKPSSSISIPNTEPTEGPSEGTIGNGLNFGDSVTKAILLKPILRIFNGVLAEEALLFFALGGFVCFNPEKEFSMWMLALGPIIYACNMNEPFSVFILGVLSILWIIVSLNNPQSPIWRVGAGIRLIWRVIGEFHMERRGEKSLLESHK